MNNSDAVFITGHEEMIGSAILRRLKTEGFSKLIVKTSSDLDLTDQKMVFDFFKAEKPDHVFLTSARVGGILANSKQPAAFIYDNIQSQTNVIHTSWQAKV